jgi:hypothetical protein
MSNLQAPSLHVVSRGPDMHMTEIIFPVRIKLERSSPGDLGVSYEFSKLFDASDFFERIPVSSLELAKKGLVFYFTDVFKLLDLKVDNLVVINHVEVEFRIRTNKFKIEPNFRLPDIVERGMQTFPELKY